MILKWSNQTGYPFEDRVGLADYLYTDCHRLQSCCYPSYMNYASVLPFYLPYRALTNAAIGNLLVAGKTMAQVTDSSSFSWFISSLFRAPSLVLRAIFFLRALPFLSRAHHFCLLRQFLY